jgi:hypothetical protein
LLAGILFSSLASLQSVALLSRNYYLPSLPSPSVCPETTSFNKFT